MNVHSTLGNGFLEAVYNEVLEREFRKNSIPFEREKKLEIFFNGEKLNKTYRADFLCFNEMVLEIKSVSFLNENFS